MGQSYHAAPGGLSARLQFVPGFSIVAVLPTNRQEMSFMKRSIVFAAALLATSVAFAAGKTYQATGPVLDVTNDTIVVDKGKDGKWEIVRDANTKVKGDLKKGAKVTVEYRMVATDVDVKEDKKPAAKK
jgi:hypothetical protein